MLAGITECGIPSMSLTDNGFVYTGRLRGFEASFEAALRSLGVRTINSTPYHPQTCGKIERFWQTLKKWLTARDPAATIAELNTLLEQFRVVYNHHRPHRAHGGGATPAEAFSIGGRRPGPLTGPCRHRSLSPVTPSVRHRGTCSSRPTRSTSDCAGPDTSATSSATASTSPSSAAPRWSGPSPPTPTRRYQRGDKTTRTYRTREPKPPS